MSLSRSIALVALALAAACGGGGNGSGGPGPTPTTLAKTATATGDSQVASPSASLPTPYRVLVRDQDGNPMANVDVTWSVLAGGGSVAPTTSPTDANGVAVATRTLGTGAGIQTARASRAGLSGSPVTFTTFSEINGAMTIAASGSANVTDTVLSTVPVAVTVTNHSGAAVSGVSVSWTVTGGGGSPSQASTMTNGSGVASINWTLGSTAGDQALQATVTGLAGSPVTFSGGAAGNAAQIALNGGNNQVGIVNTALPTAHSVLVRDGHGNPKSGTTVTWVLGLGGGSISSTSPTTNGSGIAAVTRTLGPSAGANSDTAKAIGSAVAFTDTAAARVNITVSDFVFTPATPTINAGSFVVWTWSGAYGPVGHNVTWDVTPVTVPGSGTPKTTGTFTLRLTTAGTYTYYCINHGMPGGIGMSGTITVNP